MPFDELETITKDNAPPEATLSYMRTKEFYCAPGENADTPLACADGSGDNALVPPDNV